MAPPKRLTTEELDAWRVNLIAWQLIERALDRQLQRDSGMPHAYYAILVALNFAESKSVPLTKIAEQLGQSQSRLSHAVKRLEENGWVAREASENDKRISILRLTDGGRDAIARATGGHFAEIQRVFLQNLDDADLRDIRRIGLKLVDGITTEEPEARGIRSVVGLPPLLD